MVLIIVLIIILNLSFGIKIKFKVKQEEAIFIALYGMTLMSFLLGILNLLYLSTYIINILTFVSFIYVLINLVKRRVCIKELITLPTIIYVIGMYFIYYIIKDVKFSTYDEYMFWGTNLKGMLSKDCLWANAQMDGIHLVYPPFTAITEYIFCKYNGGFSESVAYFGIISLIFTSLMPILKNEKYTIKSLFKSFSTIIITYLTIVLFTYDIANLSVDCILGIVFAIAMYVAYSINNKKDYIVLIISLISLTLIKTNGILMSGIVIMNIFLKEFFCGINQKEKIKNIIKKLLIPLILLCVVISTYGVWKIYCTLNGKVVDDRHDKNYIENIDIAEFINALSLNNKASDRNKKIVEKFGDNLFNCKIIRKFSFNTPFHIWVWVNISFLITFLFKKEKNKIFVNWLSLNIGCILYLLTLLILFLFVFQENQGNTLMGFYRYVSTYLMAMVLIVIYLIMDKVNWKNIVLSILISMFIVKGMNKIMLDPRVSIRGRIWESIIRMSIEILDNVEEDEKVYIIDQKEDYGTEFMQLRYLISPINTNLLYEWNIGNNDEGIYYKLAITEEEFINKLISEEYDYVFLIEIKENFVQEYDNILSEDVKEILSNTNEKGILLKIDKKNKKLNYK